MSIGFAVGYNGIMEHLQSIVGASDLVRTVYTGGLAGKIAGGRPQYSRSLEDIAQQVAFAHGKGLLFEVALNAPCGLHDKSDRPWWRDLRAYLQELESIGIDGVIASHPFVMTEVRDATGMYVVASTICEISSPRAAEYYASMGATVVIPSMNVNYDLRTLGLMRRALKTAALRIMVNEHCLGDCPWRRFHHSHYAHSNDETDYHLSCKRQFGRNPFLYLTNTVIRPEDICNYEQLTDQFKIVGRMVPIESLVKQIKAYAAQSFDGNYLELFDIGASRKLAIPNAGLQGLFAVKTACDLMCSECGYCRSLLAKLQGE